MTDPTSDKNEFMGLIDALCEGDLSELQWLRIRELVCANPSFRDEYLVTMQLIASLELECAGDTVPIALTSLCRKDTEVAQLIDEELVRTKNLSVEHYLALRQDHDRKARSERSIRWWNRAYMAVASVAASLVFIATWFAMEKRFGEPSLAQLPEHVATLQSTAGATWQGSELPTASMSRLIPGTLQLRSGVAQIRFDSGAIVAIHGPATLDIESRNRGFLRRGKLLARVPPPAVGFTIETPSAIVVDLGTEFGIAVNASSASTTDSIETEVHVFEGEVDLTPQSEGVALAPKRRLVVGEAARLEIEQDESKPQPSYSWHAMVADPKGFSQLGFVVPLQNATATFSQTGGEVQGMLDPDRDNGWSVNPRSGINQTAVVETVTDIGFVGGTRLTFTLEHLLSAKHNLGRFRLSVTTDARSLFANGLQSGGDVTATWTVLDPLTFTSSGGATFSKLGDMSLLLSGVNPDNDTYTVTAQTALTGITGFRLESLTDASLPSGGSGRIDHNFVLTQFVVTATPLDPIQGEAAVPRSK